MCYIKQPLLQPMFLKPPFIFLFDTQWTEFQSPRDTDRYWGKLGKLFWEHLSFLCEFVDANYTLIKKAMPLWYCCFRSILCWSDFLLSLLTQNAPVDQERIYQTDFIKEHQPKYFIGASFAGNALKLEKVSPTFSSFNPCPHPGHPFATYGRKQFQCFNIVLNKTRTIIFEIQLMWEKF